MSASTEARSEELRDAIFEHRYSVNGAELAVRQLLGDGIFEASALAMLERQSSDEAATLCKLAACADGEPISKPIERQTKQEKA